jgi:uncharacterized ubiquitin-like protein YukD
MSENNENSQHINITCDRLLDFICNLYVTLRLSDYETASEVITIDLLSSLSGKMSQISMCTYDIKHTNIIGFNLIIFTEKE